ncbi:MAG: formyltetrahydrofolate deformylase [Betaproteobacteria bacterium]|nr:formyltetrahydrofolate deformylase [Betaproteobacteria bacterium]NBT74709.1 formyltetrahydrofolate deformylase [Betaproteobacteria bacterium]NBY14698.1 formyltetrahydrofolate deformylase [Betaproteobacteria bacterium]NCA15670.1 formyltetrahydrofolate deformylase [Betaproteobacteria bacterium]NDF04431.1 formyltetrahydrofolate deformylase [Betaproteobacteria bacterium]
MTILHHDFILTLSCPDAQGIVFRVSECLFQRSCNILDSAQFGDDEAGRFFMRVHFDAPTTEDVESLSGAFSSLAHTFDMQWQITRAQRKCRVLLLVSRLGHCLNDLLYRTTNGQLPVHIAAVASNHPDLRHLVEHHGVPFHFLPVDAASRPSQEAQLRELSQTLEVDLIVLARYMQVISPELCVDWAGRAINIHHSFLPSFKGAKPYDQAFARGVKIIGATSHYITTELDEGPIIEQDVERVDHTLDAQALSRIGGDIESRVLARAVRWHAERRILINGHKTVIFR